MVKIIYTWPNDFHLREGKTSKVYSFTKENNWTLDVDWDVVYKAVKLSDYIKIDGDPKAKPKSGYKTPSVMLLWELGQKEQQKTIIENEQWKTEVVNTNDLIDEIIEPVDDFKEIEELIGVASNELIDKEEDKEEDKEGNIIIAKVWTEVSSESVLS